MPTLHLLDAASPQACPAACALIRAARGGDAAAKVLLLGGAPLRQMAATAGLMPDAVWAPPLGKPWLAPNAGGRLLASFNPTAITAWSVDALLLARWRLPQIPTALVLLQAPTATELRLLALLHRARPFTLRAPHGLLQGGALAEAQLRFVIEGFEAPRLPLQFDVSPLKTSSRPAVLLLGSRADAWRAASALGILDVMEGAPPGTPPRHFLRLLPDQHGLAHALRLANAVGQAERLQPCGEPAFPLPLSADTHAILVLASPGGPDATQTVFFPHLCTAHAPLVVEDVPALRALAGTALHIHWVRPNDLPALAHALRESTLRQS